MNLAALVARTVASSLGSPAVARVDGVDYPCRATRATREIRVVEDNFPVTKIQSSARVEKASVPVRPIKKRDVLTIDGTEYPVLWCEDRGAVWHVGLMEQRQ
ncbi:hypothetical protein SAMN06297251_10450 [Fulvimarina manganoxydans]|uniref:Uncharacterized protein n=1 Tax=Fulvimarina manganoxydans TaxID=937218 RepID=A0A1W2AA09_9HYPH|nr:hypothetical protein [Fulvimarina manganoxydans]SMC57413.1 hypothetical protein SAMN06297251_10450 [Fulvimarina manganoxydans]